MISSDLLLSLQGNALNGAQLRVDRALTELRQGRLVITSGPSIPGVVLLLVMPYAIPIGSTSSSSCSRPAQSRDIIWMAQWSMTFIRSMYNRWNSDMDQWYRIIDIGGTCLIKRVRSPVRVCNLVRDKSERETLQHPSGIVANQLCIQLVWFWR